MISQLLPGRRVQRHTSSRVNNRIQRETDENVEFFARHPALIDERLESLENEWDIERSLETNASSLMLIGVLLGAFLDRRFLVLPGLVAMFLLQHGLQGWCPPLPVLRRIGMRTEREIHREYYALKALRGDFSDMDASDDASPVERSRAAIQAVDRA